MRKGGGFYAFSTHFVLEIPYGQDEIKKRRTEKQATKKHYDKVYFDPTMWCLYHDERDIRHRDSYGSVIFRFQMGEESYLKEFSDVFVEALKTHPVFHSGDEGAVWDLIILKKSLTLVHKKREQKIDVDIDQEIIFDGWDSQTISQFLELFFRYFPIDSYQIKVEKTEYAHEIVEDLLDKPFYAAIKPTFLLVDKDDDENDDDITDEILENTKPSEEKTSEPLPLGGEDFLMPELSLSTSSFFSGSSSSSSSSSAGISHNHKRKNLSSNP